jgi:hypothetical protein
MQTCPNVNRDESGIEAAFGVAVKLHAPLSSRSVTVMISPITHYEAQPALEFRQVSNYKITPETKTLTFDLEKNRSHRMQLEGHTITLELQKIDATPQASVAAAFRYHFVVIRT